MKNFIKDIIVDNIEDKETIDKLEMKYIAYERASNGNGCYNITDGGEGSTGHFSEEHKKRISEKSDWKGTKGTMFGKHHSEDDDVDVSTN